MFLLQAAIASWCHVCTKAREMELVGQNFGLFHAIKSTKSRPDMDSAVAKASAPL